MDEKIQVIQTGEMESGPPTGGMVRNEAFATDSVWIGEVRTSPGAVSGWHHHGEHTTYGRVLSGRIRFELGRAGSESVTAGPGDFFLVPPNTVHREGNPETEEQVLVVVRFGSGPTVINVQGP